MKRAGARVRVAPRIPEVRKETMALTDLLLPTGGRVSVTIGPGASGATRVEVILTGQAGTRALEIALPWADPGSLPRAIDLGTRKALTVLRDIGGLRCTAGVRLPARLRVRVEFSR